MAVSGSRDFILTRDNIIDSALRKLKVIIQGGTPTANQYTYASEALNILQHDWENDGIFLWTNTDLHIPITASVAYATVSSAADVVEITDVIFRENGEDKGLTKLSRSEYQLFSQKKEAGSPNFYYVEYLLASTKIWLHPIYEHSSGVITGSDSNAYICSHDHTSDSSTYPTTGASYATCWDMDNTLSGGSWVTDTNYYSGHIRCTKTQRLQDLDATTNNPDFHVRAYNALILELTATIAPEYVTLREAQYWDGKAKEAKTRFLFGQAEKGPIYIRPRIK